MSTSSRTSKALRSQSGMVSIMTTLILMIVISLIVLGFAQISRRNQRQQLDRQLSTQAFYAAETGVNDVQHLVANAILAGTTIPLKNDCSNGNGATAAFYSQLNPILDATNNVSYSCVMVDPAPGSLQYSDVSSDAIVAPINASTGGAISSLRLKWQTKDNTTTPINNCPLSANAAFSAAGNWDCGYGVLRFDLVPTAGAFDQAALQANTMTTFAVPLRSGGTNSVNFSSGTGNANNRVGVHCTNTDCTLDITGLTGTQYYMRLSSVYKDVSLQINGTDATGAAVSFVGAQVVIDATGKAQDVLRRIQVHSPLNTTSHNTLPNFAVQSTESLCKRFSAMAGFFDSDVSGVTSGNPLCQP